MRIEKIIVKNFRILENVEFTFDKTDVDLHVIVGANGSGKTTLIKAIRWCLLGRNPVGALSSPLANFSFNLKDGDIVPVTVELHVSSLEKGKFIITRNHEYLVRGDDIDDTPRNSSFVVRSQTEHGEAIHNELEGKILVENLFPNGIDNVLLNGEDLGRFLDREMSDIDSARFATMGLGDKILMDLKAIEFAGILLVDSPFGRLGTMKRKQAMSIFQDFASRGQVVLLVPPTEFSEADAVMHNQVLNFPM